MVGLTAADHQIDPCHPVIAIPDRVKQIQPAWRTCVAGYQGGFYDPPKTLQQAPVLVPTAQPGPSVPALPENTPTQVPPPPPPPASSPADPANPPPPPPPAPQPQQPPASAPSVGNPQNPQQPPAPGSSTTIIITPPPSLPKNSVVSPAIPPVITLAPGPDNPGQVVTLIPIATPNSPNNPSNPNQPNSPSNPSNPNQPNSPSNPNQSNNPASQVIVIGTQTLAPGKIITVGGTTSTLPNGQTTVFSGTQISFDPSATQVVVGGSSTIPLAPTQPATAPGAPLIVTFDGSTFTANSANQIIIGSQTLAPGELIIVGGATSTLVNGQTTVVGGTTILLALGATQIVVGGTMIPLTAGTQQTPDSLVITVGGTTLTANSLTQFVFGSSTLSVGGPALTVSGTTYSLTTNADGSTVLIAGTAGASSVVATSATTTGSAGVRTSGGTSGGSSGGSATGGGPQASNTGAAATLMRGGELGLGVLLGGLIWVLV
ncbi:hypothetical protein K469DRAFT_25914 [Zopfia rhizophila CBS 207.26]|uniref:Uncharacterized protein n=1 Tax=Zopfia rhizophila CBS 207.26 TaxID=1314779 RepID=A0A6A6EFC3_9PEZI|nr:hypothetical protein K469DRAFT_25914 [Zopfia rhizophila CBS 207.26]